MKTERYQVVKIGNTKYITSEYDSIVRIFCSFSNLSDAINEMLEIEKLYKYVHKIAYGVYDIINEEIVARNKEAEIVHEDHIHGGSGYME
ncbi:MAG: hypothetical protein WC389_16975 [Lutibacter sp.]|jgi:hypothetical protein